MALNLTMLIFLPIAAGLLSFSLRQAPARKNLGILVLLAALAVAVTSFILTPGRLSIHLLDEFALTFDHNVIAAFIMIFINLFGLLVCIYAGSYGEDKKEFYSCLLILIGAANLTVLAADFLLFAFGWGTMLVLLYALLFRGSHETARKAVSIVGTADFMLLLGIALFVALSGSTLIPADGEGLPIKTPLQFLTFLLLFAGAAGKAGAWPFHPWIPEASTSSSMPVMALLPASLDKLLGIYLLARVCTDIFVLSAAAMGVVLLVGGGTVLFAVMMALVQKDARKLLSYHAVSQVGYMVIGFGTGVPIGFAAGLLHMLNNAIYKTGLFMTAGAAGKEKGTFNIADMGGLARFMPVTFVCALIFSLSISGVPPFNGFVSKWMVYQGAVEGLLDAKGVVLPAIFVIALIAAFFGSALTLASFIKFIHSVFLGQETESEGPAPSEARVGMRYPLIILAALCVIFGVYPALFMDHAVLPWLPEAAISVGEGEWNALLAFILLAAGLLVGLAVVFWGFVRSKIKVSSAYYGGQEASEEINYRATEFYKTLQEISLVRKFYGVIEHKLMDMYRVLTLTLELVGTLLYYLVDRLIDVFTTLAALFVLGVGNGLKKLHTGNLDFYLLWCLLAMVVILFIIAG